MAAKSGGDSIAVTAVNDTDFNSSASKPDSPQVDLTSEFELAGDDESQMSPERDQNGVQTKVVSGDLAEVLEETDNHVEQ